MLMETSIGSKSQSETLVRVGRMATIGSEPLAHLIPPHFKLLPDPTPQSSQCHLVLVVMMTGL